MRFFRYLLLFVMLFEIFTLPVFSKNPNYAQGEVIYHQDFSATRDFSQTGITKGTASSVNSAFFWAENTFRIQTYDDGRVYALLPPSDWTDDFTVEFEFAFKKTQNANGYLAFMLTSAGEEPNNISQLIFRVKGTVDDFSAPSPQMSDLIRSGRSVTVKIPVKKGVVSTLILSADGVTEELQRNSLLLIGSGNRGFSVRNADVDISEIYIVNGTDYTEKTGYYAEHSYAENGSASADPPTGDVETAPETGDLLAVMAAASAVGAIFLRKQLKKRKFN